MNIFFHNGELIKIWFNLNIVNNVKYCKHNLIRYYIHEHFVKWAFFEMFIRSKNVSQSEFIKLLHKI